jgi:hypothetical protein
MDAIRSRSRVPRPGRILGLEDLAVLCDGPGLTLRVSRDGGRVCLSSGRTRLFHRTGGRAWKRMTRRARAEFLASWIRDAAAAASGRLEAGRGDQ